MYTIALCDDEQVFMDKAEAVIAEHNKSHDDEFTFQTAQYTSPNKLLADLASGVEYDIFILDMEMDEMDGITLASQIRAKFSAAVILFLSAHTEFQFMQEGYKVQALRYISKLLIDSTLPEALTAAGNQLKRQKSGFYVYPYYSEVIKIPYTEILYIQKVKRMTVFYTDSREDYQLKRSLKDVYQELNDPRFVYVDQSTIVNLDRVLRMGGNEVILEGEVKIPVSRKMMPALKAALLRLWGGHL